MDTLRLNRYVKRYTTLSSVLETLMKKKLVLLSPSKWDDSNDVYFMDIYRNHIKANSIFALCCTMATETYHHWRVFTQGTEGVYIEFERESLSRSLNKLQGIISGPVKYLLIKDLKSLEEDVDILPFVKRKGYKDEREWRIIAKCSTTDEDLLDIPIDLTWINRVVLNPWIPPALGNNLRSIMRGIPGCSKIKIESSRLTNSSAWKAAGQKLLAPSGK